MLHTPSSRRAVAVFAVYLFVAASVPAFADDTIDEIVVTADYRGRTASELPGTLSMLSGEQIEQLAHQHFEEIVNVVPNLNWSGDGHRARYFQIRGVGELEQYQGAPNPSVGFLIDDIDFSGIGTIATLFDVDRIEVLRGPQGSRYGANALGGLVYLQSGLPRAERNGSLKLSAAGDDALSAGIAFGGSLNDSSSAMFLVSAHYHQSNGFRDNPYLSRNDTNGRDETTIRGRVLLQPSDAIDVNVAALYSKIDNGYDAFALDNSNTVLSDKPGKDAQNSQGASVKVDWRAAPDRLFTSLTSIATSDIDFSFDADWGNDDSWSPFVYDFVSQNDRERRTLSQEFRLTNTSGNPVDWLIGVYALRLEDDSRSLNVGEYDDFQFPFTLFDQFASVYEANNVAVFGQLERRIGAATRWSAGLRLERRTSSYRDTADLVTGPSDNMIGGEIALSHEHSASVTSFVNLSRGYKAGGFNLGIVPDNLRQFRDESIWNIEAGIKAAWLDDALTLNASIFRSKRVDQQVRLSFQLNPGDPASFDFATVNGDGTTTGVESELRWQASDAWQVYLNVGWLDAVIDRIDLEDVDFEKRAQAHAPRFTVAAGARYQHPSGWFGRVDLSAKAEFYFDVSHDQKSEPYEIVNVRLGYDAASWTVQLWARNLLDEYYAVRGFYFGNEPPDFAAMLYTRTGDPRQVGATFEKRF